MNVLLLLLLLKGSSAAKEECRAAVAFDTDDCQLRSDGGEGIGETLDWRRC